MTNKRPASVLATSAVLSPAVPKHICKMNVDIDLKKIQKVDTDTDVAKIYRSCCFNPYAADGDADRCL